MLRLSDSPKNYSGSVPGGTGISYLHWRRGVSSQRFAQFACRLVLKGGGIWGKGGVSCPRFAIVVFPVPRGCYGWYMKSRTAPEICKTGWDAPRALGGFWGVRESMLGQIS